MDLKPFRHLAPRKAAALAALPEDLAAFYSRHEGVGLESSPDYMIRLCELREVRQIAWKDLHVVGTFEPPWRDFSAIRIGISCFFDEILYVLECPAAPRGSILAIGPDMTNGPGGTGPELCEMSLVLAPTFPEWLTHIESLGWNEPGIGCSEIDFDDAQTARLKAYYGALNPHSLLWGK